ncbi:DUF445 family protein [Mesorhizobium sp. NBSH29]|uniref:DUF445 domain-containing protein n=1 Tax=Mesorhizobium sp. NBSH29 TaxID=2654249 RepID=UPI001896793C|nr:DUF445 family protein [Mesorhizobium sp. NBSH29]QPC88043.1 DUF445 family protein [Mesorhizobium sp. NBSH29]
MADVSPHALAHTVSDAEKRKALGRIKMVAGLTLVLCLVVLAIGKSLEPHNAFAGFVAAFAEAAAIGGIADWYAVVALFRRPLGLPIPHTAIIPANQARIAENLGSFIETNFLARETVAGKLREVDFARLVADWLSERRRADVLAGFVVRLVPQMLAAVAQPGLRGLVEKQISEQLSRVEIAPLAADLLSTVTANRGHQKLLDEMTKIIGRILQDEETLNTIRLKIRDELPSLFNLFRADAYLLKRIVASAGTLMDDIRADNDHPMRAEFDRFVDNFITKLRTSRDYQRRAERLKRDLLAGPHMRVLGESIWAGLADFLERDARAENSVLRAHLTGMFQSAGAQLAQDAALRREMNAGFAIALATFVESQKSGVSSFIADQVKGWDLGQLTDLIELNVGRDLQYIRFNGMIIGGLAGLVLHSVEMAFFR